MLLRCIWFGRSRIRPFGGEFVGGECGGWIDETVYGDGWHAVAHVDAGRRLNER